MEVYFGPNGHGKTYFLEKDLEKDLIKKFGKDSVLFMPSEIIDEDEAKDTIDSSLTMEYILSEILNTIDVKESESRHRENVREVVEGRTQEFNEIVDDILMYNNQKRDPKKDFLTPGKLEYKKLVSIDRNIMKNHMGTGQKRLFLLSLINKSEKNHIILDEPEQHLHKSLIHKLAEIIRELSAKGKNIYIVTHSAELLSLLGLDLNKDNIYLFNDPINYEYKKVDLNSLETLDSTKWFDNLNEKHKKYYNKEKFQNSIRDQFSYEFYKVLFSKKVYIVEGINDELFLKCLLKDKGQQYSDYSIFKTHGKFLMPVYSHVFDSFGIDVNVMYDEDSSKVSKDVVHREINKYLSRYKSLTFEENIEAYFDFQRGNKHDALDFLSVVEENKIWKKLTFKKINDSIEIT